MNQPQLGIKISEIRNLKGITQKELSESCNIDIRTIQRIESGEVTPRTVTLRLIAEALSCELSVFMEEETKPQSDRSLLFMFITGIVYLLSTLLMLPVIPQNRFLLSLFPYKAGIYVITGVLFYYGFYIIGTQKRNSFLRISSINYMILIPLFIISLIVSGEWSISKYISHLLNLLISINSIFFGIGLIKEGNHGLSLWKLTGILLFIQVPFIIIPQINFINWWIILLTILLQLLIVYKVHKTNLKLQTELVIK